MPTPPTQVTEGLGGGWVWAGRTHTYHPRPPWSPVPTQSCQSGRPGGDLGCGAGSWVGRWRSSWKWLGQVTAGRERRGLGRGGVAKGLLWHLGGTRLTSAGLSRSGDGESDLGYRGSGVEGGKSGNDIRDLCSGRGGPRRPGRRGRGREDLDGASGPGAGPGPLPGGVSCRVRPPRLSPPSLRAAPCMVSALRSPRPCLLPLLCVPPPPG